MYSTLQRREIHNLPNPMPAIHLFHQSYLPRIVISRWSRELFGNSKLQASLKASADPRSSLEHETIERWLPGSLWHSWSRLNNCFHSIQEHVSTRGFSALQQSDTKYLRLLKCVRWKRLGSLRVNLRDEVILRVAGISSLVGLCSCIILLTQGGWNEIETTFFRVLLPWIGCMR